MKRRDLIIVVMIIVTMLSLTVATPIARAQKAEERYFFTLNLMAPETPKVRVLTAQLLGTELAKIGIKLDISFPEFAAMQKRGTTGASTGAPFSEGGYDMYLVQTDFGATVFAPGIYTYFRSDQRMPGGNNYNNYFSGRFDMLINQALAELDTQKSMGLVKQASAVLYEDLPSLPLFHQSMFYIGRKDITYPKDKDLSFWQTAALRWASRTTSATERDKTLIYAQPSDAIELLPGLSTSSYGDRAVSYVVYEALVEFLRGTVYREGGTKLLLAKSYDASSDGLTHTFRLKDNVKWHDGAKFTANDVKFTYELVKDPKSNYGATKYFQKYLKSVSAPDDNTVVVTLTERVPFPFETIFDTRILPAHLLKDVPPDKLKTCDLNTQRAIGTGPWKWVEWKKGEYIKYAANPDYHGGKPWFDTLYMKVIPEPAAAFAAIEKGEIDATEKWYGYTDERKQVEKNPNLVMYDEPSIGPTICRLNLANPILANVWVRRAISYAVPRQHIIDAFCAGAGIPGYQFLNPMSPGYNKDLPAIPYSIEKAKEAMIKAGYNYDWLKPPPETPLSAFLLPAIGGLIGGIAIGALAVSFIKKRK